MYLLVLAYRLDHIFSVDGEGKVDAAAVGDADAIARSKSRSIDVSFFIHRPRLPSLSLSDIVSGFHVVCVALALRSGRNRARSRHVYLFVARRQNGSLHFPGCVATANSS